MGADLTVVFDDGARVEDDTVPDLRIRVKDGRGEDLSANPDARPSRDSRRPVNNRRKIEIRLR